MDDVTIGVGLGGGADELPEPAALFRYVERADELGIDSIWMPDHAISESPELDPTVVLTTIAARTSSVKMGPSVLTLPARNPVVVANTYANLDYLTGGCGRVIMAVGLGADPQLGEAVGFSAGERAPRLREGVEILRRLWTEDDVSYDGEFYTLDGVTVEPKPADGPLDIWIGGTSGSALKRVAEYGDGWFPASITPEEFAEKHDRLMGYCQAAGRTIERDEAGMILQTYVSSDPDRARAVRDRYLERTDRSVSTERFEQYSAFGTPADCVETIQRFVDAGCTKFVLQPAGPVSERVEQLESYSQDVIPSVTP